MNARNDRGFAFPVAIPAAEKGMTLRDYFAAKAMQALIAKSPFLAEPQSFEVHQKTAIGAYEYADAMLAVREGKA